MKKEKVEELFAFTNSYVMANGDKKDEVMRYEKVRLKGGWGTSTFIVKGEPPEWIKDVDVPVRQGAEDFEVYALAASAEAIERARYSEVVMFDPAGRLVDLIKLTVGDKTNLVGDKVCYIRGCYGSLMLELFGLETVFYVNPKNLSSVLVKQEDEVVGVVAAMDMGGNQDYKVYTPAEAVRELERRIK